MEQRRLILFLGLSLAFMVTWATILRPLIVGNRKPNEENQQVDSDPIDSQKPDNTTADQQEPVENKTNSQKEPGTETASKEKTDPNTEETKEEKPKASPLPEHPTEIVHLGSADPESGYYIYVELTSQGAAINTISPNDPRYSILKDRSVPLKIIGNDANGNEVPKTFNLKLAASESDNEALAEFKSAVWNLNWELSETRNDSEGVVTGATFRIRSEDQGIELLKSYDLKKPELKSDEPHDGRDSQSQGYELHFKITCRNLSKKEQALTYVLQGPVGVPLENVDHTRKFREIKIGFLEPEEADFPPEERSVNSESMLAAAVVTAEEEKAVEDWKSPIKYIGVDNQYFAALIVPEVDQLKTQYIDSSVAKSVMVNVKKPQFSDVTVVLTSRSLKLKPGNDITHEYSLYAGPKRQDLLSPLGVDQALDFGWFGVVSKTILMIMSFLHNKLYIPYGLAIICVTVMVRGMMYPISRKQAMGAKKMKELQPQIAELKKKYVNEKEKMAQAQMKLFRDNNYNPFAGCLPVFLQLPVFIGLYAALNNSVDLRMAKFLWVDNLAAPDALFIMPFNLPFLGTEFNLLPLVTVGLFLLQQKMFMPPATDPEQAMQQKMMNYMMIFMGFMFYHVPAGLCVYFIASSLWGITERKMLDINKPKPATDDEATLVIKETKSGKKKPSAKSNGKAPEEEKPKGFFGNLRKQLEEAADQANKKASLNQTITNKGKNKKGSKKRK